MFTDFAKKIILFIMVSLLGISCFCAGYAFSKEEKVVIQNNTPVTTIPTLIPTQQPIINNETPMPNDLQSIVKVTQNNKYWVEINKKEFMLKVYNEDNKIIDTFPIAVGKNTGNKQAVGDCKTPEGVFYVDEIINSSYWTHDFKDGKGEIPNAYGKWFISLKTNWDGIGIHGTHDKNSIGTNASEGCIRIWDIDEFKTKYAYVGMKVVIK